MLIKPLKFKVKKASSEVREFLNKDGVTKVKRTVVNIALIDDDGDFVKVTSFDPSWTVPKEGQEWTLPPVKKLECFDGMIQNVMV